MKPILALLAAAAISTAIGATAYAAIPRNRAGTPPSATELGLDNSHAAAWEQLRAETIALREAGRGELRERLRQADAILADEHADLRAFSADLDSDVDAWLARSRDLRARKLAFFESLSDSEKAHVRNVMRERLARLARLRSAFTTLVQDLD